MWKEKEKTSLEKVAAVLWHLPTEITPGLVRMSSLLELECVTRLTGHSSGLRPMNSKGKRLQHALNPWKQNLEKEGCPGGEGGLPPLAGQALKSFSIEQAWALWEKTSMECRLCPRVLVQEGHQEGNWAPTRRMYMRPTSGCRISVLES